MLGRRRFISATTALGASALLPGCGIGSLLGPDVDADPPDADIEANTDDDDVDPLEPPAAHTLREKARTKGIYFGSAVHTNDVTGNPAYSALVAEQCGMLVPEVELKFGHLRPSRDAFRFEPADALLQLAEANGILFRGHTLVWHHPSTLPSWLMSTADSSNAEGLLVEHIQTVVGHYRGRVHSWDVVNEAIDESSGREDYLRVSPWLEWIGPEYAEIAFRAAAEADEQALLVYNDYGTDYDTPVENLRRTALLRFLESLLARGARVDAVGIQAHLRADDTRLNDTVLREFFREIRQLGLGIIISEMDVNDWAFEGSVDSRDVAVADCYRRYLEIVLDEPATQGVITWGLVDPYSWLQSSPRGDGSPLRPLPFDGDCLPKPAFAGIASSLDGVSARV